MSAMKPLKKDITMSETSTLPTRSASVREVLRQSQGSFLYRIVIWAAIAAIGLGVPWVLPLYPLQLAVQGATLGILALSVGWLRRQTGMLSFGHAMFYGFAGYAVGILATRLQLPTAVAVALGLVLGTALAFVLGLMIMRASGVAFAMLTLASGMLIWVAVTQSRSLTNGFDGLPVNFKGTFLGLDPSSLKDPVTAWPFIWLTLMIAIGAFWLISRSMFGRHLTAIRENEERTRFMGRKTYLPKVLAFTLSGLLASVAGTVSLLNIGYISPESLFWVMSGQALIVAVIGGVGSVWGPPAGAVAFVFLQAALLDSPYYQIIIGLTLMTIVVLAPGGGAELITRAFNAITRRMKGRSHA